MFVLKECILSLASLPAVVRVLVLNCRLPLLDSAEGSSCFPGTNMLSALRQCLGVSRRGPRLPWRGQQQYSPAHGPWSRAQRKLHLIEEAFGCLLLWPVTSLALVCVCVKVQGFEQGQFMVRNAWPCWKGQECKTLFNLFFNFCLVSTFSET